MNYCCDTIKNIVNDPRVPVGYLPVYKEFYICDSASKVAIHTFWHCPWCGQRLPESLRDLYFDILRDEYGIENDIRANEEGILPEEFKTDEWWKKRGL